MKEIVQKFQEIQDKINNPLTDPQIINGLLEESLQLLEQLNNKLNG